MSDPIADVFGKLGELTGRFDGVHQRLNSQDLLLQSLHQKTHQELIEHEAREESRLAAIGSGQDKRLAAIEEIIKEYGRQLQIIQRALWIGTVGATLVGTAISLRLITITVGG